MNYFDAFDSAWLELGGRLRDIEINNGGLGHVLQELQTHQHDNGFIRDRLTDVKRYTFHHPENRDKFFRVQYNSNRALRFKGAGVSKPPGGVVTYNDGCFLCRDNIRWQQEGRQLGYEIEAGGVTYYTWMNPFPLLPAHAVVATADHVPQDCGIRDGRPDQTGRLLANFIELASRMPGFIGFYNGVGAGASIPGHLHFHFFQRPLDEPEFPLERAAGRLSRGDSADQEFLTDYPLMVVIWRGKPAEVADKATHWLSRWIGRNEKRLAGLTGNFIATSDPADGQITLYFAPRDRSKARASGDTSMIGGLEVMGELVYSTQQEKRMLDDGTVDYFSLQSHLASVYTPFYLD